MLIILSGITCSVILASVGIYFLFVRKPSLDDHRANLEDCKITNPKELKHIFVKTEHMKSLKVKNS